MEGGTEPDYDEFERLLCEIPNATSSDPQPNTAGLAISSLDLKMTSHEAKQGSNAVLPNRLAFERPTCVNNFRSPFNQNLHSNCILDELKVGEKNKFCVGVSVDASVLPDDQSLTSAFAEMNFKEGVETEQKCPAFVKYKTLPDCAYMLDGQYPNSLKNSLSGLDSVNLGASTVPNMLNSVSLVSPPKPYHSLANVNGISKFSGEMNSQEIEMKKQMCVPFASYQGGGGEPLQNISMYPGNVPFPSKIHPLPILPKVPVPGVDMPVSAFQQQYYLDAQSPYVQQPQPHLNDSNFAARLMEDRRLCRIHQQYLYLQQLQNHESEFHPVHANSNLIMGSMAKGPRELPTDMPISSQNLFWSNNMIARGFNMSDNALGSGGQCHYFAQGFCGRGERCPSAHVKKQTSGTSSLTFHSTALPAKEFQGVQVLDKGVRQMFPEKILTRSHGLNSLKVIKSDTTIGHESPNHANSNGRMFPNGQFPSLLNGESFRLDGRSSHDASSDNVDLRHTLRFQPQKYNSVDEVVGKIYLLAKDQHGCRFLQRKFTEGSPEDVQKIFVEIIGHIVELMIDPFGNYLVQKLLEVCSEDQMMQILHAVSKNSGDLVRISCDMHGTRAVQKVIETLKKPEQISMVVSALKPGIVMLIKDMNGNHVAQRCLSYLMPECSEFLFEAAILHCVELATDRHGCCVLQKCLQHSDGEQRQRLMEEIALNALVLSQDPFGNYVVQNIIDQGVPWASESVLDQLEGNYGYLSMQKYSSNVVEKCLKFAGDERRARIIQELIDNSRLGQILQDPYGNYVVQSALSESKGAIHAAFVEAIRPHVPALRSSPYGKKILSSNSLKNYKKSM